MEGALIKAFFFCFYSSQLRVVIIGTAVSGSTFLQQSETDPSPSLHRNPSFPSPRKATVYQFSPAQELATRLVIM